VAVDEATGWDVFSVATSGAALLGTAVALRFGASPHRWGPVVGFLVLWAGAANYAVLANLAARRRALRLQTFSPPRGVLLSRPLWILLRDPVGVAGVGAALGAVAAGLGFPSVGAGILLTLGALAFVPLLLFASGAIISGAIGLTFEATGLRVHVRGAAACLVPWTSMVEVTLTGPAHHRAVNVRIVDPRRVIASVVPDNLRNRQRIEMFFWMGEPRGEALSFNPWTGGIDSPTLLRVLREAKGEPLQQAN
jgi:hypothetical protein